MKKIGKIEELHGLLFNLAEAVHKISCEGKIPYYLAYGSMLGAVRHKGFIPWDDDMDIAIHFSDSKRFETLLKERLPEKYKVLTRYDNNGAPGGYLKIVDTSTIVVENSVEEHAYTGVFLDVFFLYPCTGKTSLFSRFFLIRCFRYIQMNRFFMEGVSESIASRLLRRTIKLFFARLKRHTIPDFIEKHLIPIEGDYLCAYSTIYNEKDIIPKYIYGTPRIYEFGPSRFYGVEKPDEYLKHIYGDYMKLPPVDKRRVHISEMYYL